MTELNFEEFDFVFDFDNEKSFKCERCGMCCMSETDISLTSIEVNRITDFLDKNVDSKQFQDFVNDILAFLQRPDFMNDKRILGLEKKKIYNYYTYGGSINVGGKFYLLSYSLRNLAPTNRCPFYNPVKAECFVYDVRPHVCRMFPFIIQVNQKKKLMQASLLNPMCGGINKLPENREELEKEMKKIGLDFFKEGFKHEKLLSDTLQKYNIELERMMDAPEMTIKNPIDVYVKHRENINKSREKVGSLVLNKDNFVDIFVENDLIRKPNSVLSEMLEKGIELR